jgi:hypothetical protein
MAFILAGALIVAPSASAANVSSGAGMSKTANTPLDCSGWWHFTGNDPKSVRMVRWGGANGRPQFNLMIGKIQGIQHGWAQLSGAKQGDWVTLDVTTDGGQNWGYCGPFEARWDGDIVTTPAARSSSDPNLRFRVCGAPRGVPGSRAICTSPW